MRPIFCGNFEYDARQSELERLFKRYGRVERVDMKSGFAFIYMEDERDAEDAIRALDRVEFGRKGRRLRVEWTKQERGIRRPGGGGASRRSASTRPSKTLFVINFDPHHTRIKDLERHFEPYGRIVNVRIRRNFAFVQYEAQEDATRALEATNLSKLMDRVISVEYAVRDDDERRNGYSPNRSRDRSPDRRSYDRRRSPSPYQRGRGSPDYGHGPSRSPNLRERASPNYGRRRSPSPYRRDRASPEYGRASSHSPYGKERSGVNHGDCPTHSPYHKESSLDNGHHPGGSPYQKERSSPSNGYDHVKTSQGHSPYGRERINLDNGRGSNYSPDEEGGIPENGQHASRNSMPDERDSPHDAEAESAKNEGYNQSSPADE